MTKNKTCGQCALFDELHQMCTHEPDSQQEVKAYFEVSKDSKACYRMKPASKDKLSWIAKRSSLWG